MIKKYSLILYILLVSGLACGNTAEINVYAQVDDREPIYAGQRFILQIVVDGDNTPGSVDETPLKPFSPGSPQVRDFSQSSTIIVNGQTTRNVVKRYVISYSLVSAQAGDYIIPPLNVQVGGEVYKTAPIPVKVLEPETTNRIAIEASLSQQECYVGQPVVLNVRWYVWQTVAGRVSDYMFDVPAFESGDFTVDELVVAPAPNQRKLVVGGEEVTINQRAVKYGNNDCVEVSFSKVLLPNRAGTINLGKIRVLCKINVSTSRFDFQSEHRSFAAATEELFLNVKPLPQEGKPADFYGLIGDYDITATATPLEVKVGDPITLQISIGKNPYLEPVRFPDLEAIKELSDNFIISSEQSSPVIDNGRKVFTQTIRARNENARRIPPILLSCFDPKTGEYITRQSEPIALNVAPTKVLTLADVEGGSDVALGRRLDRVQEGISANYAGTELLEDMSFDLVKRVFAMPVVFVWALPFVAFVVSLTAKAIYQDKEGKAAIKRRKTAAKRFNADVKKINTAAADAKLKLAEAIKGYFAGRFDKLAGSLTSDDCGNISLEATGDNQLAAEIAGIIEKCEAGRYSPMFVDFDKNWIAQSIQIIERIEKCVR